MATEQTTTAIERAQTEIDRVLSECNVMALREMPALTQAVTLASGVRALRDLLSDDFMKKHFMPLQGTALGFLTDRDNAKEGPREYGIAVVREVMIEALIHGFMPVGNEINIIAGRCYGAKNGYLRKVGKFPGISDLQITFGVPHQVTDGALVPCWARWRLDGKTCELRCEYLKNAEGNVSDTRIVVRVNKGMGTDAILGKAERKLLKRIYDRLMGSTLTLSDGDVLDTIGTEVQSEPTPAPVPPEQDGRRIKMGGNGKNGEAAPEPKPKPDPSSGEVPASEEPPAREPGAEG